MDTQTQTIDKPTTQITEKDGFKVKVVITGGKVSVLIDDVERCGFGAIDGISVISVYHGSPILRVATDYTVREV